MRLVLAMLAAVVALPLGGLLTIVVWFLLAQMENNPSAGGAYVAMAMATAPIGAMAASASAFILTARVLEKHGY